MSDGPPPIQPTNPYHIARAYGLQPPARVHPAQALHHGRAEQAESARAAQGVTKLPSQDRPGLSRLLAARVSGGVDFSGGEPAPKKGEMIIPFYRHPADRNAAATNIQVGRTLDVSG